MSTEKRNTLRIRTPEGIEFSFPLAGPVTRCLAWTIDGLAIMAASTFISMLAVLQFAIGEDAAGAVQIVVFFLVQTGYAIALEYLWRGQTLGKRVLRLRVMDEEALPLRFHQVVIRNLMRFVDCLPVMYFVGGITCLLNRHAQRLGDLAGGTVVVRNVEAKRPDLSRVLSGKFNSLRQLPHLAGRLRQRVSPDEGMIAFQALLRRDEMEATDRVRLFEELADHFRRVVTYPPEIAEGISDENYVRNVVEILFDTKATTSQKTA